MENRFYSDFDSQRLEAGKSKSASEEVRSAFQIDRDRIVFSYAFRRLQSKTQVFQSGEFDFYRTRLTHSIEVAKIARSIAEYLNSKSKILEDNFRIDSDLVEAVGMAHDLGHPPFGHIGERKLNAMMRIHGGFEGNAQTVRILTRLFYNREDGSKGMNPSRALLDGILKYKVFQPDQIVENEDGTLSYPEHHFLYEEDRHWLDFVFADKLKDIQTHCNSHNLSLNKFRSLECQIMDWADDTAYSINDIIDSIQAGYLNPSRIQKWAEAHTLDDVERQSLKELLQVIMDSRYESFLNKQIGDFIHAVTLVERENPLSSLSNRYRFGIEIDSVLEKKASLYKRLAVDLIFRSPQIHRIEYKGGLILEQLFGALTRNYIEKRAEDPLNLIPEPFGTLILNSKSEAVAMRMLCDSVAEMTDSLAIRTYKQLFDPDFGSILDIV